MSTEKDEYRHVVATGTLEHGKSVLVQAVTERGGGFWLLTPMHLSDSSTVLINRGFLPTGHSDSAARAASEIVAGPVTVTGLLRISEPGGAFLRSNDPANDRWYSPRRRRHSAHQRPWFLGRTLFHRRRCHAQSRWLSGRRPDCGPLPQQPSCLCTDLVCPCDHDSRCDHYPSPPPPDLTAAALLGDKTQSLSPSFPVSGRPARTGWGHHGDCRTHSADGLMSLLPSQSLLALRSPHPNTRSFPGSPMSSVNCLIFASRRSSDISGSLAISIRHSSGNQRNASPPDSDRPMQRPF
jgi:hypothetical protein